MSVATAANTTIESSVPQTFASYLCTRSNTQTVYCTLRFWISGLDFPWRACFSMLFPYAFQLSLMFSSRARALFSRIITFPARYLHHMPRLLRSYFEASPFVLIMYAPFDVLLLIMFKGSAVPWGERCRAVHVFQSRGDDEAAKVSRRRIAFSFMWTLSRRFIPAGQTVCMSPWMIAMNTLSGFALVPVLFKNSDLDALHLAIKATDMGDQGGQPGALLGDLVGMPMEWRNKFKEAGAGYGFWIHAAIGWYCVYTQELVKLSWKEDALSTQSWELAVGFQTPNWASLSGIPLALAFSALVGVLSMWAAQITRHGEPFQRLVSAFLASVGFALVLANMNIGCTWTVWLTSDAALWIFGEWRTRRQKRDILEEFDKFMIQRVEAMGWLVKKRLSDEGPSEFCPEKVEDVDSMV